MIALFTDFGLQGPYVGQVHAVLATAAPAAAIVDLFHDVPAFDIRAAAYLLPAYTACLPGGSVCVAVVDPGVGGPRRPMIAQADERWFVGPDNGLFTVLARRARRWECRELLWRPAGSLSASFHGRDLFAPAAAELARGSVPASRPAELTPAGAGWPDEFPQVLYIDRYGNAITGVRAETLGPTQRLRVRGHELSRARVFADAPVGATFWYENSNGLAEIAANQASAADRLGIRLGDEVELPG
jgi:hypothetical protein